MMLFCLPTFNVSDNNFITNTIRMPWLITNLGLFILLYILYVILIPNLLTIFQVSTFFSTL